MKIRIYTFDKIKNKNLEVLADYYAKLTSKYVNIESLVIKDKSEGKIKPEVVEKYFEGAFNIILSESGKTFSTLEFSNFIEKKKMNTPSINFFVGNAYGFKDTALEKSDLVMSLSPFTFPHEIAIVLLYEQLFRSFNLMAGGKYHK